MDKDTALKEANRSQAWQWRRGDKFILRFVALLILMMLLFSCSHYVWYRYHIETDAVTNAHAEKAEIQMRLDLSNMYHDKEMEAEKDKPFELIPFKDHPNMTMDNKDGAK